MLSMLRRYGWQIYLAGFVMSWTLFLWLRTCNMPPAELDWTFHAFGMLWPAMVWPLAWLGLLVIVFAQYLHG
jgi:hypothetical protein